jgi:hypothetical protein
MSLSKKQQKFTECISKLIAQAYKLGYALTFGDAYRDPRVHGVYGEHGVKESYAASKSVHKLRLAVDFNLFVDGEYITSGEHIAYQQLGEFWEGLDPDARWGGRFDDANHFSFEQEGCK